MAKLGTESVQVVTALIASIGALNWLAVEFLDENLLVDTLGMSGDPYSAIILIIGASGAVAAYNFGVVELLGDPMEE
jgi:uncharacterized membrane protein YuzA (DUF378 family)